jgi:hypothetical protein
VALVVGAELSASDGEGLTGTAPGPYWTVVGPSGLPEGIAPGSDPGEEVVLEKSLQVVDLDILDVSFVNVAVCYEARGD